MDLAVWGPQGWFGRDGYCEVATSIEIRWEDNEARAVILNTEGIRVSDELARLALGVRQVECPNIGKLPGTVGSFQSEPWFGRNRDGDWTEHCSICNYRNYVKSGDPKILSLLEGDSAGEPHPHRTYDVRERDAGCIDNASWSQQRGRLTVPGAETGTLILWVPSFWHRNHISATAAARAQFPDAKALLARWDLYVLRTAS